MNFLDFCMTKIGPRHLVTRAAIVTTLIAILAGTSAAIATSPSPAVKQLKVTSPQRLLFVGNSYLYYNDSLHNHVRRMVIAAGIHKKT